MPPKKAAKAKAKDEPEAQAPPDGGAALVTDADSINEAYLMKIQNAISVVKAKLKKIEQADALSVQQGGYINPLTKASLQEAMAGPTKQSTGGLNIFMLNLLGSYTPGVPYNMKAIKTMRDRYHGPSSRGISDVA